MKFGSNDAFRGGEFEFIGSDAKVDVRTLKFSGGGGGGDFVFCPL